MTKQANLAEITAAAHERVAQGADDARTEYATGYTEGERGKRKMAHSVVALDALVCGVNDDGLVQGNPDDMTDDDVIGAIMSAFEGADLKPKEATVKGYRYIGRQHGTVLRSWGTASVNTMQMTAGLMSGEHRAERVALVRKGASTAEVKALAHEQDGTKPKGKGKGKSGKVTKTVIAPDPVSLGDAVTRMYKEDPANVETFVGKLSKAAKASLFEALAIDAGWDSPETW